MTNSLTTSRFALAAELILGRRHRTNPAASPTSLCPEQPSCRSRGPVAIRVADCPSRVAPTWSTEVRQAFEISCRGRQFGLASLCRVRATLPSTRWATEIDGGSATTAWHRRVGLSHARLRDPPSGSRAEGGQQAERLRGLDGCRVQYVDRTAASPSSLTAARPKCGTESCPASCTPVARLQVRYRSNSRVSVRVHVQLSPFFRRRSQR